MGQTVGSDFLAQYKIIMRMNQGGIFFSGGKVCFVSNCSMECEIRNKRALSAV
jgi:hypothetical protein